MDFPLTNVVEEEEQQFLSSFMETLSEDDRDFCQRMQVVARDFVAKYNARLAFPYWYNKTGKNNHQYLIANTHKAIERIERIWKEYPKGNTMLYAIMSSCPVAEEKAIRDHRVAFMLHMDIGNHSMPI